MTFNLNDPRLLKIGNDKSIVEIYNFFLLPIKGALLSVTNGKDDMPIFQFDELKPLTYYKIKIPVENYIKISQTFTFDKLSYRMINMGEKYEDIKKINVCWKLKLKNGTYGGGDKALAKNQIINLISQMTHFAYVLCSDEFKTVCLNWEKIYGKKLDKFPWKRDDGKGTGPEINKDEAKRCWNLEDKDQLNDFFRVMGVNSTTYSGCYNRNLIEFGIVHGNFHGLGVTLCAAFGETKLGYGIGFYNRWSESDISETRIISEVLIHEMAHMFGYMHYSYMCVGPFCESEPKTIQTLAHVLSPYMPYTSLLSKENNVRCGYNKLEKYMYENEKLFSKRVKESLERNMDKRNAKYDENSQKQKQKGDYQKLPEPLRSMFMKQKGLLNYLSKFDEEFISKAGSNFYKLTKK